MGSFNINHKKSFTYYYSTRVVEEMTSRAEGGGVTPPQVTSGNATSDGMEDHVGEAITRRNNNNSHTVLDRPQDLWEVSQR